MLMEKQLKEQIEAPMVRLSYAYAMDVVQAKIKNDQCGPDGAV